MSHQLLSHCERITDQGITGLVSGVCSSLQVVELDNCPLISDRSLEVLRWAATPTMGQGCTNILIHCILYHFLHQCLDSTLYQTFVIDDILLYQRQYINTSTHYIIATLNTYNVIFRECSSLHRIDVFDCQQISRYGISRLRVSCNKGVVIFTPNCLVFTPSNLHFPLNKQTILHRCYSSWV